MQIKKFLSFIIFPLILGGCSVSGNSTPSSAISTPSSNASYPMTEVAKHNSVSDCWTAISGDVYNLTSFISQHPGGPQAIISICGQDGTTAFNTQGGRGAHSPSATNVLKNFWIGKLK